MKKKLQHLSLLVTMFLFSCDGVNQIVPISNICADFTVSEKLEFELFNEYEIFAVGRSFIEDSILWHLEYNGSDNFGYCYDLKTGEKLSIIAMKGKAAYEFNNPPHDLRFTGDSIQFYQIGRAHV